jgi:hypothetical protein
LGNLQQFGCPIIISTLVPFKRRRRIFAQEYEERSKCVLFSLSLSLLCVSFFLEFTLFIQQQQTRGIEVVVMADEKNRATSFS